MNENTFWRIALIGFLGWMFYFVLSKITDLKTDQLINSTILFATLLSVMWYTIVTNQIQETTKEQITKSTEQISQSKDALSVELTLKLDDKFNNSRFTKQRQSIGEKFFLQSKNDLAGVTEKLIHSGESKYRLEDILDFFETIALLVRQNILHEELVWHTFYHWLHYYYCFADGYIKHKQKEEPTVYTDIVWLHDRLYKFELKKDKDATKNESAQDISEFLVEESTLDK